MKWIDMWHRKFLQLTYCMINVIRPIVRLKQQRSSINRQLRIRGAPEARNYGCISNQEAKFIHFQVHRSHFGKRHMVDYYKSSRHIRQSHLAIRQSRWDSSTYDLVRDTARIFVAELELFHPNDRSSVAPENPGGIIMADPALHIRQSH
jgi:hypothetical protein